MTKERRRKFMQICMSAMCMLIDGLTLLGAMTSANTRIYDITKHRIVVILLRPIPITLTS